MRSKRPKGSILIKGLALVAIPLFCEVGFVATLLHMQDQALIVAEQFSLQNGKAKSNFNRCRLKSIHKAAQDLLPVQVSTTYEIFAHVSATNRTRFGHTWKVLWSYQSRGGS